MSSGADFFLKKTLGEDFFESLQKFDLWKPGTKTVLDHEEIRTALQIVPRAVMSFLLREVMPMKIDENKEIQVPFDGGAVLKLTKHERDVYSGQVDQANKMVVDFKYRSLPGIGLILMSALELYDIDMLSKPPPDAPAVAPDTMDQVQKMIDQRMELHDLIGKVVDRKMAAKDAIDKLVLIKLTESLKHQKAKEDIAQLVGVAQTTAPMEDPYFRGMANGMVVADAVVNDRHDPKFVEAPKKELPLKKFLENRKDKLKKNEFSVQLTKGETVDCPDCQKNIFDGQVFAGCVCLGDDMNRKVYIKKTEDGIKIRFGKGWDLENMEMLLETLRSKRG